VEDIWSDPDLQTINAVKNRKVYYTPAAFYMMGPEPPRAIIETFHMAKLFHPDKFEDLDLEKEGNEIFERFYGVDGLWTEIGGNLGFI
jgi:iron complex transport system substrate-binding protein